MMPYEINDAKAPPGPDQYSGGVDWSGLIEAIDRICPDAQLFIP